MWHETDMPTALRDVRFQGQSGKHMLASSFSGFDPYRSSSALRWRCGAVTNVVFSKNVFGVALSSEGRMRRRALIKLVAGSEVALPLDHRRHRSRRWRLEALNARRIKSQLETGESHVQET